MSGRTKIRWCHISSAANPLLSPPGGLIQTLLRGEAGFNREGGGLFKLFSEAHQREQGFSGTDFWFPGVILLFLTIRKWGGHEGLRYCGIGLFSYGISVISILTCCIAVSSSSAVCCFSSFWLTVFGEIRLFTVLRYRLFALSFRYKTQKKHNRT